MRGQTLGRLRERMQEDDIEALAVTRGMNLEYLFDIHPPSPEGFAGVAVITQDDWQLFVSKFYRYSVEGMSNAAVYTSKDELQQLVAASPLEDGDHADDLSRFADVDLEPSGIVASCRRQKLPVEVDRMRRACDITAQVFEGVLDAFEPGLSEWSVVRQVDDGFREQEVLNAFPTLAHASVLEPHRLPEQDEIEEGETLLLDMGCRFRGYCADMTRMVPNDVDGERKELVAALGDVQSRVLDRVAAGVEAAELAGTARDMVEEHGYSVEEQYLHSLGHGVGLAVHEAPQLHVESEATLEPGDVVTIEPGLYVPGVGGVRIEDQVVVREDGFERLTEQKRMYER